MAYFKAVILNIAIAGIWYLLEWFEFGELQLNRDCDGIIWLIYLIVLCFYINNKDEKIK